MKKILIIRIIVFAVALIVALVILSQSCGRQADTGTVSPPPVVTGSKD